MHEKIKKELKSIKASGEYNTCKAIRDEFTRRTGILLTLPTIVNYLNTE